MSLTFSARKRPPAETETEIETAMQSRTRIISQPAVLNMKKKQQHAMRKPTLSRKRLGKLGGESHEHEEVTGEKRELGIICTYAFRRPGKRDSKEEKKNSPPNAKRLDHFFCWSAFRPKPET
jgi:hypothetical protein